jgi:hypothetical protein
LAGADGTVGAIGVIEGAGDAVTVGVWEGISRVGEAVRLKPASTADMEAVTAGEGKDAHPLKIATQQITKNILTITET